MIFISPYHPELNPIERLWKYIKDKIAEYNEIYGDLKIMSNKISGIIAEMSNYIVKNMTFSSYIKKYFNG
jgi:transposase